MLKAHCRNQEQKEVALSLFELLGWLVGWLVTGPDGLQVTGRAERHVALEPGPLPAVLRGKTLGCDQGRGDMLANGVIPKVEPYYDGTFKQEKITAAVALWIRRGDSFELVCGGTLRRNYQILGEVCMFGMYFEKLLTIRDHQENIAITFIASWKSSNLVFKKKNREYGLVFGK